MMERVGCVFHARRKRVERDGDIKTGAILSFNPSSS